MGGDDGDGEIDLPEVELYGPDGDRVEPAIFYRQGSNVQEDIAAQIQNDLARIGVNLQTEGRTDLLAEDFGSEPLPDEDPDDFEYAPGIYNAGPPDRTRTLADWDMVYGISANSYPRTPEETYSFWLKDAPTNAYGYVPEVDMAGLYEDLDNAESDEETQELVNEIMGALTEELPANFMSESLYQWGFEDSINTSDDFGDYGYSEGAKNRYRDEQTVGGDYTWLSAHEFDQAYLPEQEDANSARRTNLLSDGAFEVDTNDEVYPHLLGLEETEGGEVWVCTLRDNLQFGTDADGNEYGQVTADDWVYMIENVHGVADDAADMWNEDVPPGQPTSWDPVENVEANGDLEFQIELASPDPNFKYRPILWGMRVLPQALFEEYAPDAQALRQSTEIQEFTWTGNLGPYTFEDRTAGQTGSFTMSRNEDYYMREHVEESNVQTMDEAWADAPYFDQYQFDVEGEQSTLIERFRGLEADRTEIPSEYIQEFEEENDDIRVETEQDPYISFLFFNQRSNGSILTRERDGREAIARVVDKEVITQQIQRGAADPAVTFQPTWSEWYDESAVNVYGIDITEDDVEAARDLLRENDNFTLEEV